LDQFADKGGVPVVGQDKKYYKVTGESGLTAAFTAITTSLVRSCTIPLKEKPVDTSLINVAVDCTALPQTSADGTQNWAYDDNAQSIQIMGNRCTAIESTGAKRIDVINGCPIVLIK
jgi:hypothetical protein